MGPFCGVDVSNMRTEEDWERVHLGGWEIWDRRMMVLTYYTYHACQAVIWDNTITLGNRKDPSNLLK